MLLLGSNTKLRQVLQLEILGTWLRTAGVQKMLDAEGHFPGSVSVTQALGLTSARHGALSFAFLTKH